MERGPVAQFTTEIPSLESHWRAIILFGQNVASYKFALAGALLELGSDQTVVEREDVRYKVLFPQGLPAIIRWP